MQKIELTKGQFTLVDDEDFNYLNQWKWHISTKGYALRCIWIGSGHKNRKGINIYMHGEVNKTPKGYQTDHINRNKLDNRKSNLRTEGLKNRKFFNHHFLRSISLENRKFSVPFRFRI